MGMDRRRSGAASRVPGPGLCRRAQLQETVEKARRQGHGHRRHPATGRLAGGLRGVTLYGGAISGEHVPSVGMRERVERAVDIEGGPWSPLTAARGAVVADEEVAHADILIAAAE